MANYNFSESNKHLLAILRCPKTMEPLAEQESGILTSFSGNQKYSIQNEIPSLIGDYEKLNLSEIDTQNFVSQNYEKIRYSKTYSRNYFRHTFAKMAAWFKKDGIILDNGCGNGIFHEILGKDLPSTMRFVGLDISENMLNYAKSRLPTLIHGDSCNLPFQDKSFDSVLARGLFHHLPDPKRGMSEVARVLKPGGYLLSYEPHKNLLSTIPRWFANKTKNFDDDHKSFTRPEVNKLVEPELELVEVIYYGYIAYPLLSFPDLIDFSKFLPLDRMTKLLIKLDDIISKIPMINRLSWAFIIVARKPISK